MKTLVLSYEKFSEHPVWNRRCSKDLSSLDYDLLLEVEVNDAVTFNYSEVSKFRGKKALWMIDTYLRYGEFFALSPVYDYLFVSESRFVENFSKVRPTWWLPLCVFRKPIEFNCEESIDVGFSGNLAEFKPLRNLIVQRLSSEYKRFIHKQKLNFYDYCKFICSCKINLNISSSTHQADIRVFEVLYLGKFLLTSRNRDTDSLFNAGVHLDTFGSYEELISKIDFYLRNEQIRKKIAERGKELVRSKHLFKHRVEYVERVLKSFFN